MYLLEEGTGGRVCDCATATTVSAEHAVSQMKKARNAVSIWPVLRQNLQQSRNGRSTSGMKVIEGPTRLMNDPLSCFIASLSSLDSGRCLGGNLPAPRRMIAGSSGGWPRNPAGPNQWEVGLTAKGNGTKRRGHRALADWRVSQRVRGGGRRGSTALDSQGHHPWRTRGGLGVNRNGGLAVGGCEDRDICAVAARATLRKMAGCGRSGARSQTG